MSQNFRMRQLLIPVFILIASSRCLAEEKYHNDEFGFTLEIPAGWYASFENDWPEDYKNTLKRIYEGKTLLVINPLGIKAPKPPCIQIRGRNIEKNTTNEVISSLEKTGKEHLTFGAEYIAKIRLGKNRVNYQQVDSFYNYDSEKKFAIAKILYKKNDENIYYLSASSMFVGLQRAIDIDGYSKNETVEEFWQIFTKLTDSFAYDKDTAPKGVITSLPQEIKEVSKMSKPEASMRFMKLTIGIIIGLLIIGVIIKAILNRFL